MTIHLWCPVDLFYFPLDSQRCRLQIMSCKCPVFAKKTFQNTVHFIKLMRSKVRVFRDSEETLVRGP